MNKIYQHIIDYTKSPVLVRISDGLFALRFDLMKIYSVLYAVEELLSKKIIDKNTVLIESSSGVYALSLALVCHKFGMRCCLVLSEHVDKITLIQLKLLGNVTIRILNSDSLEKKTFANDQDLRVGIVHRLLKENPNMYWMRQYHDPIHYKGYRVIAEMIKKTVNKDYLLIVGPVGSGASTCGIAQSLNNILVNFKLTGIQPFASITFREEYDETFLDNFPYNSGLGTIVRCQNVDYKLYNDIHFVSEKIAKKGCIELVKDSGIFAGYSSGASYKVAQYEHTQNPKADVIFICPDQGYKYLDIVYKDHELVQNDQQLKEVVPKEIKDTKNLLYPWSFIRWRERNNY